jgi:hypothetical protein
VYRHIWINTNITYQDLPDDDMHPMTVEESMEDMDTLLSMLAQQQQQQQQTHSSASMSYHGQCATGTVDLTLPFTVMVCDHHHHHHPHPPSSFTTNQH